MSLVAVQLWPSCQQEAGWVDAALFFWVFKSLTFVFTDWRKSESILDRVERRSSFTFLVEFIGTEPQICLHLISASLLWPPPAERTYVVNNTDYSTCSTLINCISISFTRIKCSCLIRLMERHQGLFCRSHVGRDSIIWFNRWFIRWHLSLYFAPRFSMQRSVYATLIFVPFSNFLWALWCHC